MQNWIRCQTCLLIILFSLAGCAVVEGTYDVVSGTVKGVYYVTSGTVKAVYHVGKFTFNVVKAPIEWSLMNEDIETIDGLPVKEAIRLGRVKNSPYRVKGLMEKYYPIWFFLSAHMGLCLERYGWGLAQV